MSDHSAADPKETTQVVHLVVFCGVRLPRKREKSERVRTYHTDHGVVRGQWQDIVYVRSMSDWKPNVSGSRSCQDMARCM